jgi:hypothetical protein
LVRQFGLTLTIQLVPKRSLHICLEPIEHMPWRIEGAVHVERRALR